MIKYINKKEINWDNVKKYLAVSEKYNHYTNNGPVKRMLEEKLNDLLHYNNVLCVNSGTSALHLLMNYLVEDKGVKTFATTDFNFPSVLQSKHKVKVFDIDAETGHAIIDDDNFDAFINVNLFGINTFGKTYSENHKILKDKIIINDNSASPIRFSSNSLYNIDKEIKPLNENYYVIGSLHHTKLLGYGEGGFIKCLSPDQYLRMEELSNFGYGYTKNWSEFASNFKMSDVSAAFILSHLKTSDFEKHYSKQCMIIDDIIRSGLNIFTGNENIKNGGYILGNIPVVFKDEIDVSVFRKLGIEAQKYYKPLNGLKNSKYLYDRIINLPVNENMTEYDIHQIYIAIRKITDNGIS
jgi:dTDP-4-amino-4,6-dideoxygalactose transaminase